LTILKDTKRGFYPSKIVLIGFMGSGKSTVGKKLSEALRYPFFDLDRVIEDRAGMSVEEIFRCWGENCFREKESQALKEILKKDRFVLSCGGGVVERKENVELIKRSGAMVVWLDISFEAFKERLPVLRAERPLLKKGLDEVRLLYKKRKKLYSICSTYRVVVDEKSPDELVKGVICLLRRSSPDWKG